MISIDITDRQIKLVRGVHSGSKVRVQDADMRDLTLGMVSNGYITDVPMVAAELNDIIKSKEIKEKEAIVSITSSSIVYKELLINKPKSMKNTVAIEAMIQAEMGVTNEYNISYTIAGEMEDEEKNKKVKVIATACPQRLVDGYVRLFSHIGLNLKAVNIANNSVTRLILNTPKMADRMPLLLIQVDRGFLNMNLYEDNQIVFSRFFNIDPADYDNAPDYVTRAVNDNLFRMIQFIRSRKGAKPLKEIMFYGDIQNFIELSNAVSGHNVPAYVLSTPSTVIAPDIDFTKFANAIGAIYRRNKELEHINLLEATSAKESKGMNGYLLALGGSCLGAAALIMAIYAVFGVFNSNIQNDIKKLQTQIDDPVIQRDISIVNQRQDMLSGFENYNANVDKATLLFNYMPKATSHIYNKLLEPIDSIADGKKIKLDVTSVSVGGYNATISFKGLCMGDPSAIPSTYVEKLVTEVKDEYGDPFFENVSYTGFSKVNSSIENKYVVLRTEGKTQYDTVFEFSLSMNVKAGCDEENATINLEETAEAGEVTE